MGYKFYSQKGTKHYELLGIGQCNIGIHREHSYWKQGRWCMNQTKIKEICNIFISMT